MEYTTPATTDVSRLDDLQLLASAKELARRERHLNLRIIEHLREIGSRGLHLRHGYGSLFDYAVKELGFGEGSAYQRLQALKLSDEFPEVKQDLKEGELTLTAVGYLQSAFDRDERRQRQWERAQQRRGEPVVDNVPKAGGGPGALQSGAAGETEAAGPGLVPLTAAAKRELIGRARGKSTRQVRELIAEFDPELVRPRDRLRALGRERWELKATIDEECRRGLEQLRHWLSHVNPAMDYGDLLRRMVADAVAKYDPAREPARGGRQEIVPSASAVLGGQSGKGRRNSDAGAEPPRSRCLEGRPVERAAMGTVPAPCSPEVGSASARRCGDRAGQQRAAEGRHLGATSAQKHRNFEPPVSRDEGGRHVGATITRAIPAAVRRHIWLRDRGRCTYRDPTSGRCCGSRHLLQVDHIQPYAMGGSASVGNLRFLCAAHNRARSRAGGQERVSDASTPA